MNDAIAASRAMLDKLSAADEIREDNLLNAVNCVCWLGMRTYDGVKASSQVSMVRSMLSAGARVAEVTAFAEDSAGTLLEAVILESLCSILTGDSTISEELLDPFRRYVSCTLALIADTVTPEALSSRILRFVTKAHEGGLLNGCIEDSELVAAAEQCMVACIDKAASSGSCSGLSDIIRACLWLLARLATGRSDDDTSSYNSNDELPSWPALILQSALSPTEAGACVRAALFSAPPQQKQSALEQVSPGLIEMAAFDASGLRQAAVDACRDVTQVDILLQCISASDPVAAVQAIKLWELMVRLGGSELVETTLSEQLDFDGCEAPAAGASKAAYRRRLDYMRAAATAYSAQPNSGTFEDGSTSSSSFSSAAAAAQAYHPTVLDLMLAILTAAVGCQHKHAVALAAICSWKAAAEIVAQELQKQGEPLDAAVVVAGPTSGKRKRGSGEGSMPPSAAAVMKWLAGLPKALGSLSPSGTGKDDDDGDDEEDDGDDEENDDDEAAAMAAAIREAQRWLQERVPADWT